jgi:hypothetical protein
MFCDLWVVFAVCFGYCLCDPFPFSILFDSMKSSSELFVHEEFEVSNDYLGTVFKKGLSFS